MQLAQDIADVRFDGALADDQLVGDLGVPHAPRDHRQHGALALRELVPDELDALAGAGIPVAASVSMRSLAEASVRRDWAPLLAGGVCTVLVDMPLTRHLRLWTADAGALVRYGLGEYAVGDRRGVCLGLRVETDAGASRLHVAVVSPSFAAALEVWLAGTQEVSRRVVRDDELLDEHEVLLSPTMGHLLVEEPFFDFKAGDDM